MSNDTIQQNIKPFAGEFNAQVNLLVVEAYSVDGGPFIIAKAVPVGGFTVEANNEQDAAVLSAQTVQLSSVIELIDEETYMRSKRVPIGIQATVVRPD
jgi:hypothetical protein